MVWLRDSSLLQDETNAVKKYRGIHFGKMTASRVKTQKGKLLYPNPLNIEFFLSFLRNLKIFYKSNHGLRKTFCCM